MIALSAVPADGTALRYTGGEPHAPTAHFGLTHGAIHAAKGLGVRPHVGAIATSDTFYDPDPERHRRWAARGVLAVEMEAAVLFTIGALRGVADGLHPDRLRSGRRRASSCGSATRRWPTASSG